VTPGNVEFVQVVTSMSVWTGGMAAILRTDERRHPQTGYEERTWLPSTRDAAILGAFLFGLLYAVPALLIHFSKSRWWPKGLLVGFLLAVALVGVDAGLEYGEEAAIDWLGL
jgi:hypothetical protein